jgi:hypothetical protein
MSPSATPRSNRGLAKFGRLLGMATVLGGTAALLLIGAPADAAVIRHVFKSTGI